MRVAERIIKKIRLPNKQLKYQVKWKGSDELTWETEDGVHEFRELVDDYLYFTLTGERYDGNKIAELRIQYKNEFQLLNNENSTEPTILDSKKNKKEQKLLQKNDEQDLNLQKQCIEQISGQQKEILNQITQQQVTNNDVIEYIILQITTDSNLILQIEWKNRIDGIRPYAQFYSFEQFKQVYPILYIQFIETCILECENQQMDIKFKIPDNISVIDLICKQ